MKILYLDPFNGCAGDMFSGALLDSMSHEDAKHTIYELNSLGIPNVEFVLEKVNAGTISASRFRVLVNGEEETPGSKPNRHKNHSQHHHPHHHLSDIKNIIESLDLPSNAAQDAFSIYESIAKAESEVHGRDVADVHFHEVGALDAIADVVSASYLVHMLSPDKIVSSAINVGSGTVECAHGTLPVPTPATEKLLKGMPSYGTLANDGSFVGELCTPTGAAILSHFVEEFGAQPSMTIISTGYGAGHNEKAGNDFFRAIIGESINSAHENRLSKNNKDIENKDEIVQLACNIDDMTPEDLGYALDVLNDSDEVLDAFFTPIQMKKSRPAIMLTALVRPEFEEAAIRLIFHHTTTLGIRRTPTERYVLDRKISEHETAIGKIRIKASSGYGTYNEKPEFDDLRSSAVFFEDDKPL